MLMVTFFTCVGLADSVQITHYRLKFKATRAFAIESNAKYLIPAGEYALREMEKFPDHLFSLERVSDKKHMALVTTVRIDRERHNFRHKDRAVFDYENPLMPVFKEFYVTGANGWEIIEAEYNEKAGLILASSLTEVKYTVTQTAIEPEPEPAPAPVAEPEPAPAPKVEEPVEEPKPEVTPIPERKRVRKD